MQGFGACVLLFCLLRFGTSSAFAVFLEFVIPGDTCVSNGIAGRALLDELLCNPEHPVPRPPTPAGLFCLALFVQAAFVV